MKIMSAETIINCEKRERMKYEYLRSYYDEAKKTWVVLQVCGGEFSSLYVPDHLAFYYRKLFSTPMSGSGGQMQALHHARKHDKAFTLKITKSSHEPICYKPHLVFPDNTKTKVQFILLDDESMVALLMALPTYINEVIPSLENNVKGSDVAAQSEYSTFSTTPQVRGQLVLKEFPSNNKGKETSYLDMSLIQFSSGSFSLDLRYFMDGAPGFGIYINSTLWGWLMEEREVILKAAQTLRKGNTWYFIDSFGAKRKAEQETVPRTPMHSPDNNRDSDEMEIEGGSGRKYAKLSPAASEDKPDAAAAAEAKKVLADEFDAILADPKPAS